MKNTLYILVFCSFLTSQAQEKKAGQLILSTETADASSKKIIETKFEVQGVCGMCEKRIEEAALRTKGVKVADWDKESKVLKVVFNSQKTSLEAIHANIAEKGHSTELVTAEKEVYKKLPDCCQYADGAECKH